MTPKINDSCIGCGTCEAICSKVFKVADVEGRMMATILEADYETEKATIEEAMGACPVQAITLE